MREKSKNSPEDDSSDEKDSSNKEGIYSPFCHQKGQQIEGQPESTEGQHNDG